MKQTFELFEDVEIKAVGSGLFGTLGNYVEALTDKVSDDIIEIFENTFDYEAIVTVNYNFEKEMRGITDKCKIKIALAENKRTQIRIDFECSSRVLIFTESIAKQLKLLIDKKISFDDTTDLRELEEEFSEDFTNLAMLSNLKITYRN